MQLISNFNKETRFSLWVVPLKDKKGITFSDAFQKILDESGRKPCKIWVDKGNKCYKRSMKS